MGGEHTKLHHGVRDLSAPQRCDALPQPTGRLDSQLSDHMDSINIVRTTVRCLTLPRLLAE